jgi:hypothetical protein
MKAEELLYHYAKDYLHHNVQTVLLYENWFHKIPDVKDARYMQEYIIFRDHVNNNNFSDAKIVQELKYIKKHRIDYIYKKLYNNMIELLERTKKIPDADKKTIDARLNVFRSLEYVNFLYINELRNIEEERN